MPIAAINPNDPLPLDSLETLPAWSGPIRLVDPTPLLCLGLSADSLVELVELFASDATARLGAMRAAVERSDASALRALAHAARGAGAMVGALEVADICAELEPAGGTGIAAEAGSLIDRLERALVPSAAALRALARP
jgi:HPt (histidine-containing phosphotransfer) domain-containing protein